MSQFVDDEALEGSQEQASSSDVGCSACGEANCGCGADLVDLNGEDACIDLTRSDATVGFKRPVWTPYEEDHMEVRFNLEILAHAKAWVDSLRCQEKFEDFAEDEPTVPDLHAYFAKFPYMDWSDIVRLCRAHANFLQAQHQPRGIYKKHKTSNQRMKESPPRDKSKAGGKRVPPRK